MFKNLMINFDLPYGSNLGQLRETGVVRMFPNSPSVRSSAIALKKLKGFLKEFYAD